MNTIKVKTLELQKCNKYRQLKITMQNNKFNSFHKRSKYLSFLYHAVEMRIS